MINVGLALRFTFLAEATIALRLQGSPWLHNDTECRRFFRHRDLGRVRAIGDRLLTSMLSKEGAQ